MTSKIIFGNITFHHFSDDELKLFKTSNPRKALVHSIGLILSYTYKHEYDKIIDENEDNYESWLAPSEFNGEVVFENENDKKSFELFCE